jgi:hypothetical protein
MDLAGMKYGFSASFHHEQMFFDKAKGYTAPKCLTKVEYVPHENEICIFGSFSL